MTTADKPDLPHGLVIARGAVRTYADAIEAWARADERRKARAELIADLHAYADRQYCIGIERLRQPECLGWEHKVRVGKFGEAEMQSHKNANKAIGAHFGIYDAIRALPTPKEGHEDQ